MPTMDFRLAPTLSRAWHDEARVRIIIGPVGSGKTTWCCGVLGARMMSMPVCRDGVLRYRAAIVRTSLPTMRTTTLNTWKQWYPPGRIGHMREQPPIKHTIRLGASADRPDIEAEFVFMGLDETGAIDRLKSFEITDLYFAELSELQEEVFTMARGRIGRYPPTEWLPEGSIRDEERRVTVLPDGSTYYPKVIADTNQTDDQHWLAALQDNPPQGWSIYQQPPAVLELVRVGGVYVPAEGEVGHGELEFRPRDVIVQAGRAWGVNPNAENLLLLDPGYYQDQQIPGASVEYIQRYLQAKRIYMEEGKPVIPEFNAELHAVDELEVVPDIPLRLGMDCGGGTMNPAATISQKHPRGIHLVHQELCGENTGTENFCNVLIPEIEKYELPVEVCWCDPAASTRDELFERAIVDHLKSRGIPARLCETNDQSLRIEALRAPFNRMVDGKPAILINRKRCPRLVKGLAGAYRFRKLQVTSSDPRYSDQPEKTPESHPCEALGYDLMGGGEGKRFRKGNTKRPRQREGQSHFNPL